MIREKRKLREVDLYRLEEEQLKKAKKKTKKYKDMKKYGDWEWLMRQVPGFWR